MLENVNAKRELCSHYETGDEKSENVVQSLASKTFQNSPKVFQFIDGSTLMKRKYASLTGLPRLKHCLYVSAK